MLTKKYYIMFFINLMVYFSLNAQTNDIDAAQNEKISYMLGVDASRYFTSLNENLNFEAYIKGFKDANSNTIALKEEELMEIKKIFIQKVQQNEMEKLKKISQDNIEKEKKFLEENKLKEGVISLENGLQYIIIKEGEGKIPSLTSKVKVHYTGYLLDGKIFDSSYQRGEPVEFILNSVIKGWQDIVTLMKVGAKYRAFIPSHLAYGEKGAGNGVIQPNETLIFEIELLDIVES